MKPVMKKLSTIALTGLIIISALGATSCDSEEMDTSTADSGDFAVVMTTLVCVSALWDAETEEDMQKADKICQTAAMFATSNK